MPIASGGGNALQYPVINPFKRFRVACIPEGICRYKGLSPGAKLVYGRLERYAGRKGVAFPHMDEIAEEVGLGERQTSEYIAELIEKQFIAVSRVFAKGYIYQFLDHPALSGDLGQARLRGALPQNRLIRAEAQDSSGAIPRLSISIDEESHSEESQDSTPLPPSSLRSTDPETELPQTADTSEQPDDDLSPDMLSKRIANAAPFKVRASDRRRLAVAAEAGQWKTVHVLNCLAAWRGETYWREYRDKVGAFIKFVNDNQDGVESRALPPASHQQAVGPTNRREPVPIRPGATSRDCAVVRGDWESADPEWTPERLVERWRECVPAGAPVDVLDRVLRAKLGDAGKDADFRRVFPARMAEAQALLAANGQDLSWLTLEWLVGSKGGRANWVQSLKRFAFKAQNPEQKLTQEQLRKNRAMADVERFKAEARAKGANV